MDKVESYKILAERLMHFSELTSEKKQSLPKQFEESQVGESGNNYNLVFIQEGNVLKGQIHDNNNLNFELLEESIKI